MAESIKQILVEAVREFMLNEEYNTNKPEVIIATKKVKSSMEETLKSHGIINSEPVVNYETNQTNYIGFSQIEQKWYGWSNDTIYGFKVGSTLTKDDAGFNKTKIHKARTLSDARAMAAAYASSI